MYDIRDRLYICTFSDNALDTIRDYGLGMEINHTCISEALDEDKRKSLIENIKNDMVAAGDPRLILHGPFTEIHPAGIDYKARELAMERLNQAYDVCSILDIKKMIVHTGWLPFIYFKNYQAEKGAVFWERFMADKPLDFEIAVENVLEDEPYMIREMMSKIRDPRIKLCLDVGHAHAMTVPEYPVEEWIKVLSPWVSHFHLHNNDGTGDSHSPFTEGTMDMESIFENIDNYCSDEVTYTIEARNAEACLEWLMERRLI